MFWPHSDELRGKDDPMNSMNFSQVGGAFPASPGIIELAPGLKSPSASHTFGAPPFGVPLQIWFCFLPPQHLPPRYSRAHLFVWLFKGFVLSHWSLLVIEGT
jgi:hypothetical protein